MSERLNNPPTWLTQVENGASGPQDFVANSEYWLHVVQDSYLAGIGLDWASIRNVMDCNSHYGGWVADNLNMILSTSSLV